MQANRRAPCAREAGACATGLISGTDGFDSARQIGRLPLPRRDRDRLGLELAADEIVTAAMAAIVRARPRRRLRRTHPWPVGAEPAGLARCTACGRCAPAVRFVH